MGAAGSYDAVGADYASVLQTGDGYGMWYSALDDPNTGKYRIAYASAPLGPVVNLPLVKRDVRH